MSSHHNHHSHVHNFFNKHTAWAIFIIVAGCFIAGYYVGSLYTSGYMSEYKGYVMKGFHAYKSLTMELYYKAGFIKSY